MSLFNDLPCELLVTIVKKLDKCSRVALRETCRDFRCFVKKLWLNPDHITNQSIWKTMRYHSSSFIGWLLKYQFESQYIHFDGLNQFLGVDVVVGSFGSFSLIKSLIAEMIKPKPVQQGWMGQISGTLFGKGVVTRSTRLSHLLSGNIVTSRATQTMQVSNVLFGMLQRGRIEEECRVRVEMNLDVALQSNNRMVSGKMSNEKEIAFGMTDVLDFLRWAVNKSDDNDQPMHSLLERYQTAFVAILGRSLVTTPVVVEKVYNWICRHHRELLAPFLHQIKPLLIFLHPQHQRFFLDKYQNLVVRYGTLAINREILFFTECTTREWKADPEDSFQWPPSKDKADRVVETSILQKIVKESCHECVDRDCIGCEIDQRYPLTYPRFGCPEHVSAKQMLKFLDKLGYDVHTNLSTALASIYEDYRMDANVNDLVEVGEFSGWRPSLSDVFSVEFIKKLLKRLDISYLRSDTGVHDLYHEALIMREQSPQIYDLLQAQGIPLPPVGDINIKVCGVTFSVESVSVNIEGALGNLIERLLQMWERSGGKYAVNVTLYHAKKRDPSLVILKARGYPSHLITISSEEYRKGLGVVFG